MPSIRRVLFYSIFLRRSSFVFVKIRPQIIAGNHIFIGANPLTEPIIFLLQIRCAKLTTDGLVLCQFLLYRCKLCYKRFNFCFQFGNGFLGFFQELFQLAFLLFLHYKFLCCCHQRLIVLTLYSHLGGQRQGLRFDLLHSLNRNLLLLDTFKGLFQFSNFLFSFLSLKFQNAEMFFVFALLLPLDAMLQHDCCKGFFLFLYPQVTLRKRSSLPGNALIGKRLFQRNTGGQSSLTPCGKRDEVNVKMGRSFIHVQVSRIYMELGIAFQKAVIELIQDGFCQFCVFSSSAHIIFVSHLEYHFVKRFFLISIYGLRENPCHKAGSMGKKNADEMLFWTNEEFKVFIKAMEDRPIGYTVFMVMYYTGLRVGELLALTPEDIDFDRHIISVNKNYQRLNGKDYIYPPKTEAGYREVVMPKVLESCLREYLAKLYDVQPTDRIFPYDRGWVGRQMKYGCDHSGTQKIRVHDVRHTHASLLIDMGCTPLLVAERLGHERVQTTMETYSHLYPNKQTEVADQLDMMATKDDGYEKIG